MEEKRLRDIIKQYGIGEQHHFLSDFHKYISYLIQNRVNLESEGYNFPRKELLKINLMMSPPEKPKEALGFEPFPRLYLFHVLSLLLGLISLEEGGFLSPNQGKINEFFSLSGEEQYFILLNTFWAKIPWGCPHSSDWDERYTYLTALTCCPIDQDVCLENEGEGVALVLEEKRLKRIWPACGPFTALIIPNLRNLGFMEYKLREGCQEVELKSLIITPLGMEVFNYFRWELTNSPEYILREAWEKLEQDDLDQASLLAQRMLEQDKYYPDTYNLLGAIHLAKKDWEEALTAYRQAREKARWWMGMNFRESFSFQPWEKRKVFLKAQLGLALAYRGQENWLMAREIFLDILELDAEDSLGVKFLFKDTEKKLNGKR